MKQCLIILLASLSCSALAQTTAKYPDPEFSNEIYLYRKDSTVKLQRLEKSSSKMDSKMKLGGFAGAESGYAIEGARSPVRLASGKGLTFIFTTGAGASVKSSPQTDSMMRANGMDPAILQTMGMNDPANMISLYKPETDNEQRKILLMKSGGMIPFASKKNKSSDKIGYAIKKIRDGYWELVLDKSLKAGEYAFTVTGMGMGGMDGGVTICAFAIE